MLITILECNKQVEIAESDVIRRDGPDIVLSYSVFLAITDHYKFEGVRLDCQRITHEWAEDGSGRTILRLGLPNTNERGNDG